MEIQSLIFFAITFLSILSTPFCVHANLEGDALYALRRELYTNNFVGQIPKELGGLKSLVSLDLFHNNLTGPIPSSLSKLSNLKFLRLNNNNLTGRIPRELTKLGNLKILNVSNNNLCGTFPTAGSFSKFTEESFVNNPRIEGPELIGFVRYDSSKECY
uniref:Uncharacterized protein n=1 Tax=Chenopodium quinoa TaxID=63459 RepID=A0A803L1F3_CHEQI